MLSVHRAQRSDALVAALGELLSHEATGDPFAPETVAVPSRGVERWLAQRLSHVLGAGPAGGDGVCANVVFPSFARVLDDAAAAADPAYADALERWAPERAVWPLLQVIDRNAPGDPWGAVLGAHLGPTGPDGSGAGRRYAVASTLAALFDRYGRSRPELLAAWSAGRDTDGEGTPLPDDLAWQAALWRQLREHIGPAPAELLSAACANIAPGPGLSVFGATRISPARIQILGALARTRDVHLWLHHPSPVLWDAMNAAGGRPGRRADQPSVAIHPLLSSMSRDVRELQQLLTSLPHQDQLHDRPPDGARPLVAPPGTLLARLQHELASDSPPSVAHRLAPADRSLQVHAAHGPARQVEVVREALLGLFAADPGLEPRDVIVMCPDVETFAPLVAASFGMTDEPGGHPAARLRVKLADRSLRQTNPVLSLLRRVLELAAGRVTATAVLDLAGAEPVRRRFGFDDDDVERLRDWTVAAGARWGLDADHRGEYRLATITQGTWRSAVDRLLLGVAMQDDGGWVGATLPLDDVDSGDIDLAGRFAELLDRVDDAVRACSGSHRIGRWMSLLAHHVDTLGAGEHGWQTAQLRRELDDVAEAAGSVDVELTLADVTALLDARLAGRPTRASFRTGTLTVCTLVPMRAVPHRVVCLLGMDDGAFPRRGRPDGDDLLARDPRTGERDPRSEDRQLFLDAICAAQEHLVIAYTGADPRTGAVVPPCVPLAELLDAVDATARAPAGGPALEHVLVRHPLQPFDRRNFVRGALGSDAPFSFDPSGLAGARAAAGDRVPAPPLAGAPLPPVPLEDVVALDDLVRFFQHPVRGFLRQRLGVTTAADVEDPDDALRVELAGLDDWAVGDRVLRAALSGKPGSELAQLEFLRGELPPGPLGRAAWRRISTRVVALLRAAEPERTLDVTTLDVRAGIAGGRVVVGTVAGIRVGPTGDGADHGAPAATILGVSYSSLAPKHRMAAWIRYLAAVAGAMPGDGMELLQWRAVTVGRAGDDAGRATLRGVEPATARHLLGQLVAIRAAGLREPLPLVLATSAEYARCRQRRQNVGNAVQGARREWSAGRFPENAEAEHQLVLGPGAELARLLDAPLDADPAMQFPDETTRFGALARLVWAPLLDAEQGGRR